MPVNDTTTNQGYQKPNIANTLADDVGRLRSALDAIDTDMASKAPSAGPTFTGVTTVDAGSAAAPSLTFTGATSDTGFYSPGADQVAISTGGTERCRIDSSGRLLVGTSSTTSTQLLQIVGYANQPNLEAQLRLSIGKNAGTFAAGGFIGVLQFTDLTNGEFGRIACLSDAASGANDYPGRLVFYTTADGAGTPTERMRIDSSGRLLVGTGAARSVGTQNWGVQQEGTSFATTGISSTRNSNDVYGSYFVLGKSRGTAVGSSTIVQSGDELGGLIFAGADGSDLNTFAALIKCEVDGTPGLNDIPGRLVFSTTADGAASPSERMRLDSSGRLLVGTGTATSNIRLQQKLAIVDTGNGSVGGASFTNYSGAGSTTTRSILDFQRSRGSTDGSLTAVGTGDMLGSLIFRGADGTQFIDSAIITGEIDGTPGLNDMPGRLVFSTTADGGVTALEAMRINNQRELLIGTTTRTANGGVLQVSNGITFPGTQSACSDPNTLDDYEEGTFTPTVIGLTTAGTGTYTVQSGKYVKVGGKVHVEVAMTWTAHTGTGNMQFSGLPFTSSTTGNGPGVAFGRISNIALTANNLLLGFVSSNSTVIPLRQYAVGGSAEAAVPIDTAGEVNFSVEYMVV